MLTIILPLLLLTAFLPVYAQPAIQWEKTLGGSEQDQFSSLQRTLDGGYILGGYSVSGISGDKSEANKGCPTLPPYGPPCTSADYWVVKLDAAGNKQWDRTLGGGDAIFGWDRLTALKQTSDGGYLLGGISASGASGDKSEDVRTSCGPCRPQPDFWVVKLDAAGNKQWDKTIGGGQSDVLEDLQQTSDGGYILGGSSDSNIGFDKTSPSKSTGYSDYWIVKLDAAGNKQWDKTIGGSESDRLKSLQQTSDGGYILGGSSLSPISGDKTEGHKGVCDGNSLCIGDYWVVKLDAAGNQQWDKTIGGSGEDRLTSLRQASDGGYLLGGSSKSGISGDKTEALRGGCRPGKICPEDYWVVKLDAAGNKQWDRTLGGHEADVLTSLELTQDAGYILGGGSLSPNSGDKTETASGYWMVKLNAAGNKVWDKTITGRGGDFSSLHQTSDGGYILGSGSGDYQAVKLAPFAESLQVGSFTLINAETGMPVQYITGQLAPNLKEGDEINLTLLPSNKVSIRANTIPATVGSVAFALSGRQSSRQLDNQVPYALFGDTTGQYNAWRPEPGRYSLTATPYAERDAQGEAGTPLTIRFTVVEKQVYPRVEWDRTLGGSGDDGLGAIWQTSDGGYLLGGVSDSGISGDKTEAGVGYWLVKLDAFGNKQWDKTIVGGNANFFHSLDLTLDGGYILGGSSETEASRGQEDYWVVKIDAAGNKQWEKTFGGDSQDWLTALQQTNDGGYLLAGWSYSGTSGDKTDPSRGEQDFWVVKLDAAGGRQWDKTFGGSGWDDLAALQQTLDGGYILGGGSASDSSSDKTGASKGNVDYWVIKLDSAGDKVWDKTIGGSRNDRLLTLQQTHDGAYLLGGTSGSTISGDKTEVSRGKSDYWVVKLDAAGNKKWDKTIGGDQYDELSFLQQTGDGGYVLGGYSDSGISGDKTEASKGYYDYWVVKMDADGNKQWDKTLGGTTQDRISSLQQTHDGGYILGGTSDSPISGDKTEPKKGINDDYWVVKLGPFPEGRQLESFTLLNAQSDQPLRTLNNGDTIHLADLPTRKLNIRAHTNPAAVGSVKFRVRGKLKMTQLDNETPYALFGDISGDYNEWTPAPGRYMLSATPYARPDARGKAGTPLTIHFTVVRKPAATVAARMEQAPPAAQTELAPTLVYPNPTSDGLLQVRLTGQVPGPVRYSLLSSQGRKLAEGTVNLTEAGTLPGFDFSRQLRAAGLYYLRIEGGHGQQTFKIMRR